MDKLKCPSCNSSLKLTVGFTGCDWDTAKGEGSGYGWPISLNCYNCGRIYTIGHVKDYFNFSEMKDELKVVE